MTTTPRRRGRNPADRAPRRASDAAINPQLALRAEQAREEVLAAGRRATVTQRAYRQARSTKAAAQQRYQALLNELAATAQRHRAQLVREKAMQMAMPRYLRPSHKRKD